MTVNVITSNIDCFWTQQTKIILFSLLLLFKLDNTEIVYIHEEYIENICNTKRTELLLNQMTWSEHLSYFYSNTIRIYFFSFSIFTIHDFEFIEIHI